MACCIKNDCFLFQVSELLCFDKFFLLTTLVRTLHHNSVTTCNISKKLHSNVLEVKVASCARIIALPFLLSEILPFN